MKKVGMFVSFLVIGLISQAFAAEGEVSAVGDSVKMFAALAAGLGIGFAAAFGALGQAKTTAAALEGIARNPNAADKMFTPMIIGLALIETLVIYTLVIAFMLIGKI
ncbi:MAG: ATP synthase F0 subunit C [Deltaproteobacteria bacterium]|nr:ATP synthase F0 subunit C [Deltaproteobacteria bacterium]